MKNPGVSGHWTVVRTDQKRMVIRVGSFLPPQSQLGWSVGRVVVGSRDEAVVGLSD